MRRGTRPSDVFGPPGGGPQPSATSADFRRAHQAEAAPPAESPPRFAPGPSATATRDRPSSRQAPTGGSGRHGPHQWGLAGRVGAGVLLAATFAAATYAGYAALGGASDPGPADPVTGDYAAAALQLYAVQRAAAEEFAAVRGLPAPEVLEAIAGRAREEAERIRAAVSTTRDETRLQGVLRSYWHSRDHDTLARRLEGLAGTTRELALLVRFEHQLRARADGPWPQLVNEITSLVRAGQAPPAVRAWADALLEELDGLAPPATTDAARQEATRWWMAQLAVLEPAAVDILHAALTELPRQTLNDLETHPQAGPALDHLVNG